MKSQIPREKLFKAIEKTLQLEYGPPTKRADDVRDQSTSTYASVYRDRTWVFPTTIVELHYGWDSQIYASLLTISYKPSSSVRRSTQANYGLHRRRAAGLIWVISACLRGAGEPERSADTEG